jgi:hypothetical protein
MNYKKNFSDGIFYFSMKNIKDKFKSNIFNALKHDMPEFKKLEDQIIV